MSKACDVFQLLYEVSCALYLLFWSVYSVLSLPQIGRHLSVVYISQWTFFVSCLYFVNSSLARMIRLSAAVERHHSSSGSPGYDPDTTDVRTEVNRRRTNDGKQNLIKANRDDPEDGRRNPIPVERHDPGCRQQNPIRMEGHNPEDAVTSDQTSRWPFGRILDVLGLLTVVLFSISSVSSVLITGLYFSFFLPYIRRTNHSYRPTVLDINIHAIASLLLLLDLPLCTFRPRLVHGLYPMAYSATYVLFSVIYWSLDPDENVVYPMLLDWNHWLTSVVTCVLVLFVGLPLIHATIVGLSMLGHVILTRCRQADSGRHVLS